MTDSVVVQGTVLPDGTLHLSNKVSLPPGLVEVEIRPVETVTPGEGVMAVLARIRAEQEARGYVPRSAEEVHAYLREMHDEWAEHDAEIEAIQEASRRARESPAEGSS
jgi:hypothetical protein